MGKEDEFVMREGAPSTLMDRVLQYMATERADSRGTAAKVAAATAAQSLKPPGGDSVYSFVCLTLSATFFHPLPLI